MALSRKFLLFTTSLVALIALSSTAYAGDTPESLIMDGHFFGEVRYRYEYVDQDGPVPIMAIYLILIVCPHVRHKHMA